MSRLPISATALIRPLAAKNQAPVAPCEATIVDITDRRLALRLHPGIEATPNRLIELGVEGEWIRSRIIWSCQGVRNAVIAAIEPTDPGLIDTLRIARHQQVELVP